jgi:gluconate kinase
MLTQPSAFNLRLPEQFRATAFHYLDGDPQTVAHMSTAENRHFMLSDLFDYVHLVQRMGGSWDQRGR